MNQFNDRDKEQPFWWCVVLFVVTWGSILLPLGYAIFVPQHHSTGTPYADEIPASCYSDTGAGCQ